MHGLKMPQEKRAKEHVWAVMTLICIVSCVGLVCAEAEVSRKVSLPDEFEAASARWLYPVDDAVLLDKRPDLISRGALFHAPAINAETQLESIADATKAANTLRFQLQRASNTNKAPPKPLALALVVDFKLDALPEDTRSVFDMVYVAPVAREVSERVARGFMSEKLRVARLAALLSTPYEQTLFVASSVRFCTAPHEIMTAFTWADVVATLDYREIDALDGGLKIHTGLFGYARNDQVRAVLVDVVRELARTAASMENDGVSEKISSESSKNLHVAEEFSMSKAFGDVLERYDDHPDVRVHVMLSRFHLQVCLKDVSQCWINGAVVALSGELWSGVESPAACEFINKVPKARLIQPAAQHPPLPDRVQPARVWQLDVSSGFMVELNEQPDEPLSQM